MALGMEMMLKSMLGVDPDELKGQMQQAASTMRETVERFDAKLDLILRNQMMLYRLMQKNGLLPDDEPATGLERECHADGIH